MALPDTIVMFGSARWGRILGQILLKETACSLQYVTASAQRAESLVAWAAEVGFGCRVTIVADLVDVTPHARAAFVANAARDHEAAVVYALSRGLPTLVEKPLALNSASAERMVEAATTGESVLALSNVFRFAKYLDAFRGLFARHTDWSMARIEWADPLREDRHGMVKTYDPSVPVFVDVLPHVISILDSLRPNAELVYRRLSVERGGQDVKIEMTFDGRPCRVELGRNQDRRRRLFEFLTGDGSLTLDFATEPGVARLGDQVFGGSAFQHPGPLTCQALAFLADPTDPRLSPAIGTQTCRLVDEMLPHYVSESDAWLDAAHSGIDAATELQVQYAHLERDARRFIPSPASLGLYRKPIVGQKN